MTQVPEGLPADPLELRDIAVEVASAAGDFVRSARLDGFGVATKSSDTDMVTDVDRASDRLIIEMLSQRRAADGILTEESGETSGSTGVRWIVDPIDGTTNFVYDHAPYTVSIAAVVEDRPLAGAVFDVASSICWSAALGHGATRDATTLHIREAPPLTSALVATGFGYDPKRRTHQAEVVARIIGRIRDIRRMGAASAELCSLAAGRVDAYFEAGLGAWDIAAGRLIAAEAGARVEVLDTVAHPLWIIAAHPLLFGPLADLLAEVGAESV